jgi:hypothetical protein
MPRGRRRSFTAEFRGRVVLEVLAGLKSQAEVARQRKLKPELIGRWKDSAEMTSRARPRHGDGGRPSATTKTPYTNLVEGFVVNRPGQVWSASCFHSSNQMHKLSRNSGSDPATASSSPSS